MARLQLPTVTLCAVTSVNVRATVAALRACLDQVDFADCLLLTDAVAGTTGAGIRTIPIAPLRSARAYSEFMLRDLADHIATPHCLVVQWDGFVLDAARWSADFLSWDYIGAPWPQFADGNLVGNGGFSLRSRKLLEACRDPQFVICHPEDISICRVNRPLLERHGIRFADPATAARFAFERSSPERPTFGFHGVYNLVPALGADRFWATYCSLDERRTVFTDYRLLMRQLGRGRVALSRRIRLTFDRVVGLFGG
jgi:hypothetical protein